MSHSAEKATVALARGAQFGLRWTAAGMLEAECQFRRIIGYRDLAKLAVAIERDLIARRHTGTPHTPTKEAAIVAAV